MKITKEYLENYKEEVTRWLAYSDVHTPIEPMIKIRSTIDLTIELV